MKDFRPLIVAIALCRDVSQSIPEVTWRPIHNE